MVILGEIDVARLNRQDCKRWPDSAQSDLDAPLLPASGGHQLMGDGSGSATSSPVDDIHQARNHQALGGERIELGDDENEDR